MQTLCGIARNQDDHTKNPKGAWTSMHQMSINNKWDGITREDLTTLAKNVNIKQPGEIIEQVKDGVAQWSQLSKEFNIPHDIADVIGSTLLLDL